MNDIKLVMFDLEGTLIKHTTRQSTLIKEGIESQGIKVNYDIEANYSIRSKKEYHSVKDFIKKILELNNTPQEKEIIGGIIKTYKELRQDPEYLFDLQYLFEGVKEILGEVKKKGIICVLLTNANSKQNQFLIEKFDIKKYFDLIVDDSCGLPEKPDPARTKFILEKFFIAPQNALIVDDSLAGLESGKVLGVKTCGVLTGNSTREMFEKEGIDYILQSVKYLEELFEQSE